MSKISSSSGRWLGVALAGPVVEGAILGLRQGPGATLALALGLPAVVAAVALLTTPTLYVGSAVLGGRLSLEAVMAASGRSLRALGLAMLGLAPLSLLLATTSALPSSATLPGQVVVLVLVALVVAMHRLGTELDAAAEGRRGVAWHLLFAGHTAVAFLIGSRLFADLVQFGERIAS
jgi:hypothetical protein